MKAGIFAGCCKARESLKLSADQVKKYNGKKKELSLLTLMGCLHGFLHMDRRLIRCKAVEVDWMSKCASVVSKLKPFNSARRFSET